MIDSGAQMALNASDASLLAELIHVWDQKRPTNLTRSVYYDGEAALKDFGISLPPQMRGVNASLGWIAKGVHAVTDRSKFQGFVLPGADENPFGVEEIAYDNRFLMEFPQAKVSSAVHGCSFLTVTSGDVQSGEPEVLLLPRAADDSAAVWDLRRRRIRGFLSIVSVDDTNRPAVLIMHTPEKVVTLSRNSRGWSADIRRNPLGVVSVSPLVFSPELKRPFGHSRITRSAMYYADAALRTIVRAEVSAEFYSAPEYYLFGADVQKFVGDDKWSAVMGRMKALDFEDGEDKPDLHRFTGASPQPHTDQLRMWQAQFADDQDLEVKFADASNPSSADAIFAAKESLITKTRDANTVWAQGAVDAMNLAVMLRDGLTSVPAELRRLSAQFTDPAVVSPSAQADAFVKRAAVIDGLGTSEVGLEMAGFTREQITRFQADQRRQQAGSRLTGLVAAAQQIRNGAASGDSAAGGLVPVEQPGPSGVGA
ncbi:phage portal protein [Curtobacterium sp. VKM Ac-1376]|uniref:phage portal protein n=1 Tax=Curtobacterium sp. VKM Ac-1376 TaxID=123312 RepID=UPI00188DB87F|nr:phage portal protein [Curtobacterium sp. VKM Ac-1376]MBF4613757.1 phage portal protein [Curtobacterium sp. VKM Ac-1376]